MDKQPNALTPILNSSDECGGEPDSDEDIITDYHIPTIDEMLPRPSPGPLPTISVSPHSPASKMYPVLEDSLQQVRELHENIQQMRTVQFATTNRKDSYILHALNPLLAQVARLSASCPILNELTPDLESLSGSVASSPSQRQPNNYMFLHKIRRGSRDWLNQPSDVPRRRSWTAVEDLSSRKSSIKSVVETSRQRSISLSSMESEADESSLIDNVDGSSTRLLAPEIPVIMRHRGTRGANGTSSTHSLNEADLQNDFNKLKAKREAEKLRLLPQRLPLQKSISTPSIIAVRDVNAESALLAGAQPTLPVSRPSGTESETEEEGSRVGQTRSHSGLHMQYIPYDRHSEKRRKRGSIFFRKKKDKNKKVTHQWISAAAYGSSQMCDVCNKYLNNKPSLYCEGCGTIVHQHTCKDTLSDCNKPKGLKYSNRFTGFVGVPSLTSSSKSSFSKRSSTDLHSNHYQSSTNFSDDVPFVPLEFHHECPISASDLCADLNLGLHESESDSWTPQVGKDVVRKLKEKDVKRQEHIYEFILTEKHHCVTLLVMQKIFVEGLQKYFQLGPDLERMFPRLHDLIDLHLALLLRLRQRQKEHPVVSSIADILLDQFSGENALRLKSAYGEFCSRHRTAVDTYKSYLQRDPRFGHFVRHCQTNPLLKKKGIPECILFVTQRLTKYPLLIEPLIKTSKENEEEQNALKKALTLVKDILVEVDSQVAEKEKEERKLDIYKRIDSKSYTAHRDMKFTKSSVLQGNRTLKFEGTAMLMQSRKEVMVIVMSDVLFFLQDNNNKYTFFTPEQCEREQRSPDKKCDGVIALQELIVREKAGQDPRSIYLMSPNLGMFEVRVLKPKDRHIWIHAINKAVQEEEQSLHSAKQNQIRYLVGQLRQKDIEQAFLLEEKMALQLKLLSTAGLEPPSPPSYRHLVGEHVDVGQMWKDVLMAVQEVSQLASSLYTTGTNLSRSVSSAGEHHSETYVSPILPKRAETFGGFDNTINNQAPLKLLGRKLNSAGNSSTTSTSNMPDLEMLKPGDSRLYERLPYRNCVITNGANDMALMGLTTSSQHILPPDGTALLSLGRDQQYAAIQLSHYVYTLLCIISQLMTSNECLQAQLQALRDGDPKHFKHNQQLEELRNLQDKLNSEKATWNAVRDQEAKDLAEKRVELQRIQEQIRSEQDDIRQQRDQLYRKMELLTSQGLLISPNVALPHVVSDSTCTVTTACAIATFTTCAVGSYSSASTISSSTSTTSDDNSSTNTSPHADKPLISTCASGQHQCGKWVKGTHSGSAAAAGVPLPNNQHQLPINLISATNQQKVVGSQSVPPVKQQIPLKLSNRLSSSHSNVSNNSATSGGHSPIQQMLPLKLVQDEKVRRTSMSGYQRLSSDQSFSPPSGESTPSVSGGYMHTRTGSSPAMMQQIGSSTGSPTISSSNSIGSCCNAKPSMGPTARPAAIPYTPSSDKHRHSQQGDEEVIYF